MAVGGAIDNVSAKLLSRSNRRKDEIAAYCRENFTAYKRPKIIEFRDDLPKSNVGKILRRELRSDA